METSALRKKDFERFLSKDELMKSVKELKQDKKIPSILYGDELRVKQMILNIIWF